MIRTKRDICNELKTAYGLENLWFYYEQQWKRFRCRYVGANHSLEDALDPSDLDFILKSLSMQQGNIWFDDVGEWCKGLDEIKSHYLVMKLAGVK